MPIQLVNGHVQSAAALAVPNGSVEFQLNVDATVVAAPYGFVGGNIPIVFQFDSNGDILAPSGQTEATIYSNAELNPQNSEGLGTYYLVTFYDANGAQINKQPMWWQFTQAADSEVDIGEMVPFQTVGGNVIYYPTSLTVEPPTDSTLGGVYANAGTTNEWISAINTNGSVTLSQPSFSNISGTLAHDQLPSPLTFDATTFSGLITAQANIQLGVAGTTSGQIQLEGSTSGQCTITAPAVSGTSTNPIVFSNSINIPSGTVYTINTDTGISRTSAATLAIGNGTAGNASGSLALAALTASGLITAQANIQLGVAGTTSGVVTLEGSTSGSCTITAPAVAGTATNPIVFSNSLEIASGAVYAISTDTGLSRLAAGSVAVGDGTASDVSGSITAATFITTGSTPTVSSGQVGLGVTTASTATEGAATLPAAPVGFWVINVGGTVGKVPYYAA